MVKFFAEFLCYAVAAILTLGMYSYIAETYAEDRQVATVIFTPDPPTEEAAKEPVKPRELIIPQYIYERSVIPIRVTVYYNFDAINRAYRKHYGIAEDNEEYDDFEVVGWYTVKYGVCEIHVLRLIFVKDDRSMSTWGHELAHCLYGNYHKG